MDPLVVAHAALVFNWGEELARFAPELKVSLITGSQSERQAKLQTYSDFDVLVTSYDLLKIGWSLSLYLIVAKKV